MRNIALSLVLAAGPILVAGCEEGAPDPTQPGVIAQFAKVKPLKLVVDQSNTVTDHLGTSSVLGLGQTFVPGANRIVQIDLLFILTSIPPEGLPDTVWLATDITQPPLVFATGFVEGPVIGTTERIVSYRFNSPFGLDKGTPYTIVWRRENVLGGPVMSWEFAFGDHYTLGEAVLNTGDPFNPAADFVFTTYSK